MKKIGGSGRIHGCIVDIDFYNHVYLDPQDATVLAFFSPQYPTRTEYPTVERLLEVHAPQLYENYRLKIGLESSLIPITSMSVSTQEVIHVYDTKKYKPSNLMKGLQYLTEDNIIRIWNDALISEGHEKIADNVKLLK